MHEGRKWLSTKVKLISTPSRGICPTAIEESWDAFYYAFSPNASSLCLVGELLTTRDWKSEERNYTACKQHAWSVWYIKQTTTNQTREIDLELQTATFENLVIIQLVWEQWSFDVIVVILKFAINNLLLSNYVLIIWSKAYKLFNCLDHLRDFRFKNSFYLFLFLFHIIRQGFKAINISMTDQ